MEDVFIGELDDSSIGMISSHLYEVKADNRRPEVKRRDSVNHTGKTMYCARASNQVLYVIHLLMMKRVYQKALCFTWIMIDVNLILILAAVRF